MKGICVNPDGAKVLLVRNLQLQPLKRTSKSLSVEERLYTCGVMKTVSFVYNKTGATSYLSKL